MIDHDIVKSALLESMEDHNMDPTVAGKISYHIDWSLIDFHLSQGHNVIFDSPCLYTEMVDKGSNAAKKYNATYKYVECYLNNREQIEHRLTNRKRMISQIQHAASEDAFEATVNGAKRPAHMKCLVIDSSQPLESYLNRVIEYVVE
ncbi:ATP-binding protein [Paenibacillus agilis]|uniref:ATP-binding protein n=1 Tax=Paenibacillus agilis TaxID=3020863 RepID=A0A559J3D3_9BACL|nr:ATP-binding protein [Paenibacillus agilis]